MASGAGNMAIEPVADPRLHGGVAPDGEELHEPKIMERTWGMKARVDPTVTFEEYVYWAKIERADEHERNREYVEKRGPVTVTQVIKDRFSKGVHHEEKKEREKALKEAADSKEAGGNVTGTSSHEDLRVTDEEWRTAARALRTASWGTVFFLITTDILGWGSCPYVPLLLSLFTTCWCLY